MKKKALIPTPSVEGMIYVVRGKRVMLDSTLAAIYGVQLKNLIKAVGRNTKRFPSDFFFLLTPQEVKNLRFQIGTSSLDEKKWGGRRSRPYVFTEHGAVMAANILRSDRAIDASIYVVRAFVRLREVLASNRELTEKLQELEKRVDFHDSGIAELFETIRQLLASPHPEKGKIGFRLPRQN